MKIVAMTDATSRANVTANITYNSLCTRLCGKMRKYELMMDRFANAMAKLWRMWPAHANSMICLKSIPASIKSDVCWPRPCMVAVR